MNRFNENDKLFAGNWIWSLLLSSFNENVLNQLIPSETFFTQQIIPRTYTLLHTIFVCFFLQFTQKYVVYVVLSSVCVCVYAYAQYIYANRTASKSFCMSAFLKFWQSICGPSSGYIVVDKKKMDQFWLSARFSWIRFIWAGIFMDSGIKDTTVGLSA